MSNYFQQYMRAVTKPLPQMQRYFNDENAYLKSHVRKDSVVLDVGCGSGRSMKFLAPYVGSIVGVEYNARMIKEASSNLAKVENARLLRKNFFTLEMPKQFDLVFASYNLLGSSEVHSWQRGELLYKMIHCTKPGGHVIASVWSDTGIDFALKYYPSIGIRVKEIRGKDVITDHGTFSRFSKADLKEMADSFRREYTIKNLAGIFYLLDIRA